MTAPALPSIDEYSTHPYSSQDLDAVCAISDVYPKFLLAQLADILAPGFLVARAVGTGDDSPVVGFTITIPDAQEPHRGVVLALEVAPGHPGAREALIAAAEDYFRGIGRDTVVFATASAPPVTVTPDNAPAPGATYAVRRFVPSDLDDVYGVELSAFGDDPYPPVIFLALADALGDGFLVAERVEGGARRVVGYLLAVLDSGMADRGWVMSLAVHGHHRGRHVGTQLMEVTEEYFRRQRRTEVRLTVDPDNDVAVQLYKQRHYDEIATKNGVYGPELSRLLMRRQLHLTAV